MNLIHIVEGHIRKQLSGTPLANKEVELLARVRMRECDRCTTTDLSVTKLEKPCLSPSKKCCVCYCDMEAKTRVLDAKCPIGKW
jgi:hypothetical protein